MKTNRGFTLIEMLVAVVIVALLGTVVWGLGKKAIIAGQMAESVSNLRQLAIANAGYIADHRTYSPATDRSNRVRWHGGRSSRRGAFDPADGYLSPYLGASQRVGVCPRLADLVDDPSSWELGSGGYGYNATYIGGTPQDPFRPNLPSRVPNPSRTLMFATTALAKGSGLQEYPFAEPRQWVDPNGQLSGPLQPSVHFRFNGKALVAWCDGTVTAVSMEESTSLNYYGGNNDENAIGFPGPSANNGWWNPDR